MGPCLHSRLRSLWPPAAHSLQGPSSAPPSTCHLGLSARPPPRVTYGSDLAMTSLKFSLPDLCPSSRVLPLSPRPSLSSPPDPICLDYEFQCTFSEASPDSQELEMQRRTPLRSVLPAGKGVHTDTPWRPSTEEHLRLDSEQRGFRAASGQRGLHLHTG